MFIKVFSDTNNNIFSIAPINIQNYDYNYFLGNFYYFNYDNKINFLKDEHIKTILSTMHFVLREKSLEEYYRKYNITSSAKVIGLFIFLSECISKDFFNNNNEIFSDIKKEFLETYGGYSKKQLFNIFSKNNLEYILKYIQESTNIDRFVIIHIILDIIVRFLNRCEENELYEITNVAISDVKKCFLKFLIDQNVNIKKHMENSLYTIHSQYNDTYLDGKESYIYTSKNIIDKINKIEHFRKRASAIISERNKKILVSIISTLFKVGYIIVGSLVAWPYSKFCYEKKLPPKEKIKK